MQRARDDVVAIDDDRAIGLEAWNAAHAGASGNDDVGRADGALFARWLAGFVDERHLDAAWRCDGAAGGDQLDIVLLEEALKARVHLGHDLVASSANDRGVNAGGGGDLNAEVGRLADLGE